MKHYSKPFHKFAKFEGSVGFFFFNNLIATNKGIGARKQSTWFAPNTLLFCLAEAGEISGSKKFTENYERLKTR